MSADAALVWSAIAEPGDAEAAWLVAWLGHEDALAWVREAAADPVGATAALAAPPRAVDKALAAVRRWSGRLSESDPARLRERAARVGARILTAGDPGWPASFADLGIFGPHALWVRGDLDIAAAWEGAVAIVGSRASTAYGDHVAAELAAGAADRGLTVVSGGAYGIDAAAHRGALAAGGTTVAVLAGGPDRLYPAANTVLLERIIATGAVVSEQPPGFAPHRQRFLSRNRLIATARATVVVEAALRSGALSTARHALDLVRPVGAVPGPVTSAASAGCLRMIRENQAALVTSPEDLLTLVRPTGADEGDLSTAGGEQFATSHERQAYGAIPRRGAPLGAVAVAAGLTEAEALRALTALAERGMAVRDRGRWTRRDAPSPPGKPGQT